MEQLELIKLREEFRLLVQGTKFENIIESDHDIGMDGEDILTFSMSVLP